MKVFVSGATGFVGRHLVRSLLCDGHLVRALVRPSSDVGSLRAEGVEIVYGDLADYPSVRTAMEDCEVAYHLGAPRDRVAARIQNVVNITGTEHVMRAAAEVRVRRVVHCSSAGVHGRLRQLPADEKTAFNPQSVYQAANVRAERIVLRYIESTGISAVIARPSAIYGPGDLRNLKLFRDVLAGRLTTIGDCLMPWHTTYVDDVVQGLRLCGETQRAAGQTYLLAGEQAAPVMDLLRAIARAGGVELRRRALPALPFILLERAVEPLAMRFEVNLPLRKTINFFTTPRAFDISKARRELGFAPRWSLEQGIRSTLAWYVAEGHLRSFPAAAPEADQSSRALAASTRRHDRDDPLRTSMEA